MSFHSTKILDLGSCAFRQWKADSHCKFIHGYRLQAKFWFGCSSLDDKNWVVDFGGLKQLKAELENQFDHTLCISADDPYIEDFKKLHEKGVVDLRVMGLGVGIERTAQYCFEIADKIIRTQTNNRCWVEHVEVWEHEKNSAIYSKSSKHNAEQFEFNFNSTTTQPLEQVPVATAVAAPAPEIQSAINHKPAPVNSIVTEGLRNPFAGTSWGM